MPSSPVRRPARIPGVTGNSGETGNTPARPGSRGKPTCGRGPARPPRSCRAPGAEPASPRRRGRPGATGQPGDGHAGGEPAACGLARPAVSYPRVIRLHLSGQISGLPGRARRSMGEPGISRARCGTYRALIAGPAGGWPDPCVSATPWLSFTPGPRSSGPDAISPGHSAALAQARNGSRQWLERAAMGLVTGLVAGLVTLCSQLNLACYPKACV